jgi:hypothetical protein
LAAFDIVRPSREAISLLVEAAMEEVEVAVFSTTKDCLGFEMELEYEDMDDDDDEEKGTDKEIAAMCAFDEELLLERIVPKGRSN